MTRRNPTRSRVPVRRQDVRDLVRATIYVGVMFAALILNVVLA